MSWKPALCGITSLMLCACSNLAPDRPSFDSKMLLPKMVESSTATVATSKGAAPATTTVTYVEPLSCQAFDQASTKTKDERNQCITDIMTIVDEAFQEYQTKVNNNIGDTNFSLDAIATVGSAAATATTGTAAKIMSAISSVASGSKTALSEDILYKATVQVLLTTMKGNRDKDAAALKLSMQQELATYPMNVAKNDLLKYLNDGTLIEAFASINQNANATAQACQTANTAVSNASKSGSLSAQAAATASTKSGTATTAQAQCNQIAGAMSFHWDSSADATTLFGLLVSSSGVVNQNAVSALRSCVVSVAAPTGFDVSTYKNPNGTIDVAQIAGDDKVDGAYKAKLLSCVQAALKPAAAS